MHNLSQDKHQSKSQSKRLSVFNVGAWFVGAALILGLDQLTKYFAINHLVPAEPLPIFPGFNLTLSYNHGIAFGMLNQGNPWMRYLLIGGVIGIILVLMWYFIKTLLSEKGAGIALALVIGGALGNLIDRLFRGYVVDFVDWYIGDIHWFTFNVADSAICVGAVILFVIICKKA